MTNFRPKWLQNAIAETKFLDKNRLLIPNVAFGTENYCSIVEQTGLGFMVISAKSDQVVYISTKYAEIFGKSAEFYYLNPHHWLFQICAEDHAHATKAISTRLRTAKPFTEEFRIIREDQTMCPVRLRAFPTFDYADGYSYFFGIFEDLSPYAHLKTVYQSSLDTYSAFLDRAITALAILDKGGRFNYVNDLLCSLLGFSRPELLARYWHDISLDNLRDYKLLIQPLVENKTDLVKSSSRIFSKDDFQIPVNLNISKGFRADGAEIYFIQIEDKRELDFINELPDSNIFNSTKIVTRDLFLHNIQVLSQKDLERKRFYCMILSFEKLMQFASSVEAEIFQLLQDNILAKLEQSVDSRDLISQLDDSKFGIILRDIRHLDEVKQVALRLYNCYKESIKVGEVVVFPQVAIVILGAELSYSNPQNLLKDANLALHSIRQSGDFPIKVYSSELRQLAQDRYTFPTKIAQAIADHEFKNFYQPIICLKTGKLYGFEALLRWKTVEGFISPGQFIPICEETGLIIPLGRQALFKACAMVRDWQIRYPKSANLKISVNLSAKQFESESLVSDIHQALYRSGLAPICLKLEITESLFLKSFQNINSKLEQILALGVKFSIDDFGTGYSSLSYLQHLPAHTLKVDQSFVKHIDQAKNRAIAQTIVSLAQTTGMDVIAEGIETEVQKQIVRELGCEYGQGYLFSKPLPEEEVTKFLSNYNAQFFFGSESHSLSLEN